MTSQTILLKIENPVLTRLIEEQLAIFKTIKIDAALPPDVAIVQHGLSTEDLPPSAQILEIPKGAVRLGEVMDRLNYLLSGRESHIEDENENIDLGEFVLKPAENMMLHKTSGHDIRLTDKERLVLRFLYEAGNAGLPRKDLLKAVWGYADDAETHTLETHIYRLRQKIEALGDYNLIKVQDGIYRIDIKKPAD